VENVTLLLLKILWPVLNAAVHVSTNVFHDHVTHLSILNVNHARKLSRKVVLADALFISVNQLCLNARNVVSLYLTVFNLITVKFGCVSVMVLLVHRVPLLIIMKMLNVQMLTVVRC
jgi:hypothetical protein